MTLKLVSNKTLLGLCDPVSNPTAYPKRVLSHVGCTLGLDKGLCNPTMALLVPNLMCELFSCGVQTIEIQKNWPTAVVRSKKIELGAKDETRTHKFLIKSLRNFKSANSNDFSPQITQS